MDTLSSSQIATARLADWHLAGDTLLARFSSPDFATGAELVAGIAEAADAANHHPDIVLRYPSVIVTLTSHDAGGVTQRDVRLARTVSDLAERLGLTAAPASAELDAALESAAAEVGATAAWLAVEFRA